MQFISDEVQHVPLAIANDLIDSGQPRAYLFIYLFHVYLLTGLASTVVILM